MARIAILGGTGPEGLGLALRFLLAGEEIIVGSRRPERAAQAADTLRACVATVAPQRHISGCDNYTAAREGDIVVLTLPFAGVEPLLTEIAPEVSGKIVLEVVNPLRLHHGVFTLMPVPAGSAGELVQELLPDAQVVSGFKNLSAKELYAIEEPLHGDVLLCSNIQGATRYLAALVDRIPQLRAIDAGALTNSRRLESVTALLLNLNRRYRSITSIKILGLKI